MGVCKEKTYSSGKDMQANSQFSDFTGHIKDSPALN